VKIALYPETQVSELPEGIDSIHIVRPVTKKKLALLFKNSRISSVSMSASCFKRVSPATKSFLEKKGVKIEVKTERGRAISIPLKKMLNAIEMRRDFRSLREIEEATGIPKSTVHYLVKYSQRKKVKNGKSTIYLK